MKKILPLFLVLQLVLAGCDREPQEMPEPSPVGGTISVRSQGELSGEPRSASSVRVDAVTRSAGDASLTYTFEAWTRDSAPRCVLHKTVAGTFTEALFDIALVPGNYDFLFWADYGEGYYETSDLREVGLSATTYAPGSTRDAFSCALGNVRWEGGNGITATLSRPLARLTVRNAVPFSGVKAVSVEYGGVPTRYDVLTGAASAPQTLVLVFPNTSAGSALVGEDFLFVPSDRSVALSVTVGGVVKTLDALQLKPNHRTNVTATFE